MLKRSITIVFALLLIMVPFACKIIIQIKGLDLKVSFSEEDLSDNLLTHMTYSWKTSRKFEKMDKDMNVFVRIWHGDDLLIQDDHFPAISTSQWEPNGEYTYEREIYIPSFIDEFAPYFRKYVYLRLSIGFYSADDQTGKSNREIIEKSLKVYPQPGGTPEIIYLEGWYNLEIDENDRQNQWRWTSKKATCIIDNPHRDALLIIRGGVNKKVFDDQRVTFKINNLILDEFFQEGDFFDKSFDIKKEMLGEGDEFHLTLETDKTFVPMEVLPGSTDQRVLGMSISFIYFR